MSPGIQVKIADNETLDGHSPIVFIGPNGAGKTRHAAKVAGWNNANLVPALRDIALPRNVTMLSVTQANQQLTSQLERHRSNPWQLANEISQLFAKFMAENSESAICFRDEFVRGTATEPEQTTLMKLQDFWVQLFPGRQIDFAGHHPVVRSEYSATDEYPAEQMSDGERVALYLAGRVLDSERGAVVIIDEPEVHFHSRLATRFWNSVEKLRADCRFIYVTHDLPFALSRRDATYVVIMPKVQPKVVQLENDMPNELAESLLAAASFSICAKRIVFCEGIEGPSLDQALYTAWFNTPDTAVVPVETSANVVRCAQTFGESNLVAGVEAAGLIDRDYWPDNYLNELPSTVRPLKVHELENLFCLPPVFTAVAKHVGMSADDADGAHNDFLASARSTFTGGLLSKQVAERVKRRCEHEFRKALNSTGLISDAQFFARSLEPSAWETSVEDIVEEEEKRLNDAVNGSVEDFHKFFPGKVFLSQAAQKLGMNSERYCEVVIAALAAPTPDLVELSQGLEDAFRDHLPGRSCEEVTDDR